MKMREWFIIAAVAMAMVALVACRQPRGSDMRIFSVGLSAYAVPCWDATSEPLTLPDFAQGEKPSYRKITITNTGNQPTGELTVEVTGNYFTMEPTVDSIAVGHTATFTITAADDLQAYSHTATVTVSGGNNIGATFDVSVTVATADVQVGSIAITQDTPYTIPMGDTGRQLTVTFTPHYATEQGINWESDAPNYVTVDDEGRLTGIAVGYANITAISAGNPTATATIRVNVVDNYVSVTSVEITYTGSLNLTEGETLVLTTTVLPDNATSLNMAWAGFNAHVGYTVAATQNANVSTITISALTPGIATIRAYAGGKHDEVTIIVESVVVTPTDPELGIAIAWRAFVDAAADIVTLPQPLGILDTPMLSVQEPTGGFSGITWLSAGRVMSNGNSFVIDGDIHNYQPGTHSVMVVVQVGTGAAAVSYSRTVTFTVRP